MACRLFDTEPLLICSVICQKRTFPVIFNGISIKFNNSIHEVAYHDVTNLFVKSNSTKPWSFVPSISSFFVHFYKLINLAQMDYHFHDKPFIQWQHSFQMKAVLPLDKSLGQPQYILVWPHGRVLLVWSQCQHQPNPESNGMVFLCSTLYKVYGQSCPGGDLETPSCVGEGHLYQHMEGGKPIGFAQI